MYELTPNTRSGHLLFRKPRPQCQVCPMTAVRRSSPCPPPVVKGCCGCCGEEQRPGVEQTLSDQPHGTQRGRKLAGGDGRPRRGTLAILSVQREGFDLWRWFKCVRAWFIAVFFAVGGRHMFNHTFTYVHSRVLNSIVGVEHVRSWIEMQCIL